jgi:hypothetical protein
MIALIEYKGWDIIMRTHTYGNGITCRATKESSSIVLVDVFKSQHRMLQVVKNIIDTKGQRDTTND